MADENKPWFMNDYTQTACPEVMEKLADTVGEKNVGYGDDEHCTHAADLIRATCAAPNADVVFLQGGTQTNAFVIDALLMPWQGVVSADSGHVNVHETGAIERGGHKVLSLPAKLGKITASQVNELASAWERDETRDHMVQPAAVYVSQPTEMGTLYSLSELDSISQTCHAHGLRLYVDGARLAYALAAPENDITLPDLARLCDAFYIGGTKCGAMFGEAVVVPKGGSIPHLTAQAKQHGALLAKGWLQGAQFEALFEDGLYGRIGKGAVEYAKRLAKALGEREYDLFCEPSTNQVFATGDADRVARLHERAVFEDWAPSKDGKTMFRLVTSWSTSDEDVDGLVGLL